MRMIMFSFTLCLLSMGLVTPALAITTPQISNCRVLSAGAPVPMVLDCVYQSLMTKKDVGSYKFIVMTTGDNPTMIFLNGTVIKIQDNGSLQPLVGATCTVFSRARLEIDTAYCKK